MITKLYNLEKGAKIYEEVNIGEQGFIEGSYIEFGHLDGMYSYNVCKTADGKTLHHGDKPAIVHLSASTPLVAYKDGYKIASEEEVERAESE